MNPVKKILFIIGRLTAAFLFSFIFFVGISKLHAMIDLGQKNNKEGKKQNQVLMEVVRKPPPKEEKKPTQRVREVKEPSSDSKMGQQMTNRFTMDLSLASDVGGGNNDAVIVQQSQDLSAEVFEEGETDERPIPVDMRPIEYPLEARERNIEGTLVVYFIIGHDGRIKSIDIKQSPSPIITREAKRTISSWRFKPGKKKGIPVNVRAKKEVAFELQK